MNTQISTPRLPVRWRKITKGARVPTKTEIQSVFPIEMEDKIFEENLCSSVNHYIYIYIYTTFKGSFTALKISPFALAA